MYKYNDFETSKQFLRKRLRYLRMANNYTHQQLANMLHVKVETLKNWERKNHQAVPKLEILLELCSIYDCDLQYLLGVSDYRYITNDKTCRDLGLLEKSVDALKECYAEANNPISVFNSANAGTTSTHPITSYVDALLDADDRLAKRLEHYIFLVHKVELFNDPEIHKLIREIYEETNQIAKYGNDTEAVLANIQKKMVFETKLCERYLTKCDTYEEARILAERDTTLFFQLIDEPNYYLLEKIDFGTFLVEIFTQYINDHPSLQLFNDYFRSSYVPWDKKEKEDVNYNNEF